MKVNRSKFIRKYLRFYRLVFGLEAPFKVLLDGNFIFAAMKYKVDIMARLISLLQEERVEIFVLRSSLLELNGLGEKGSAALQFGLKRCTILEDYSADGKDKDREKKKGKGIEKGMGSDGVSGAYHFLRNAVSDQTAPRYLLATQDGALRSSVGKLGGIPLLYLNKVWLVMEPPSDASRRASTSIESDKTLPSQREAELLQEMGHGKESEESKEDTKPESERRKRKASAPNPLACKPADTASSKSQKKRKDQLKRRR